MKTTIMSDRTRPHMLNVVDVDNALIPTHINRISCLFGSSCLEHGNMLFITGLTSCALRSSKDESCFVEL